MKSIRISDADSTLLRELYEAELAKAQARVDHIKGVISQIGGSPATRGPGRPKGYSPKKSVVAADVVTKRRRGRPPGSKNKAKRGPGRPKGYSPKRAARAPKAEVAKRGPGRPAGSKNVVKRGPGRPKGSSNKQASIEGTSQA